MKQNEIENKMKLKIKSEIIKSTKLPKLCTKKLSSRKCVCLKFLLKCNSLLSHIALVHYEY